MIHDVRAEKMKKIVVISLLVASAAALLAAEFKQHVELETKLQGDWIAAEYYVAQPPSELQQSIKSISFLTNNIVEWKDVQDGKAHSAQGRYGIYSFSTNNTQLPRLTVAPTNYPNALMSSHLLLTLSEVQLDFDSRFLQRWGKLLKAVGPDGERLLFIRKENKVSGWQKGDAW
jgi:hypothetical protein